MAKALDKGKCTGTERDARGPAQGYGRRPPSVRGADTGAMRDGVTRPRGEER